ncbi:Adenylate and Guanylate cyclase catalytic domain containing protein [Trichomonas vaginalis G3]|uniref:adenylate cyclase n=1 Tax=Trichomonas vaginalis (strain ATCC PRA-98 / G3) TaxID=412133 RepID=A2ECV6_TRIV3|nr:guanylate cyclase protein [Trichomonas vaginalis G3]EAY09501.1 Adenylate and Guanylate cyclase catalytic domain containing protein [Trichomonas vaginalis G3]KAI5521432.1 guanylate cyclase protein [Trichomonas vaginalis G3]|eukprot:XP_001321724.1 Adenylate and Guanylate cyclase catalytic domain containing protein [Trichomonas vaginalis G3]
MYHAVSAMSSLALIRTVPFDFGSINGESAIFLALYLLEIVILFICLVYFAKQRRIPLYLLITSKYLEVVCYAALYPGICSYLGSSIKDSSKLISLTYLFIFFLIVLRMQIIYTIIQNTLNASEQFFFTTYYSVSLRLVSAISIISFGFNAVSNRLIEKGIPSFFILLIFAYLFYKEVTRINWTFSYQQVIIQTILFTCFFTSLIISLSTVISDFLSPEIVFCVFLVITFLSFGYFITFSIREKNRVLQALSRPNYAEYVPSAKRAAMDLMIGLREAAPSIINLTHVKQLFDRFHDNFDLCQALAFQCLIFDDFPIDSTELRKSLIQKGSFLPLKDVFDLSLMTYMVRARNLTGYRKDVVKIQKQMWKLLCSMSEFFKCVMNEMTDAIPLRTYPYHKLIQKTSKSLLSFLQTYPNNEDGAFFLDLFKRVSPNHPMIPEMEFWANYKDNFIESALEIFPKLISVVIHNPDRLESYVQTTPNIIGHGVVEMLKNEENFTGRPTTRLAKKGPFISSFTHPILIIITIFFFLYLVVLVPYMLSTVQQGSNVTRIKFIYRVLRRIKRLQTFLFPVELFYRNPNKEVTDFWSNIEDYNSYRDKLIENITQLQDNISQFLTVGGDSTTEISSVFTNLSDEIYYIPLLKSNFSLYHAIFPFLFISAELALNDTQFIKYDTGSINESLNLLDEITNLSNLFIDDVSGEVYNVELMESAKPMFYYTVIFGFLHLIAIPLIIFISIKKANARNSIFFSSLRDTQKTALSAINVFLQSQMRNVWGNNNIWHASNAYQGGSLLSIIIPVVIYFAGSVATGAVMIVKFQSYTDQLNMIKSDFLRVNSQFAMLCDITQTNFYIYFSDDNDSMKQTYIDKLEELHSDFIFQSEKRSQEVNNDTTYSDTYNNWLDNAIIQKWVASSALLVELERVPQEYITQLQVFFSEVDPVCTLLIDEMSKSWKDQITMTGIDIIICGVFFSLIPFLLYLFVLLTLQRFDAPFMDTVSLLEHLNEKALSNDTTRALNNSATQLERNELDFDQTFYDIILQTLPDPVFVINMNQVIITMNTAATKMTVKGPQSKMICDALNIQLTSATFDATPLDFIISSYIQEDRITVVTYDIIGTYRDRRRYYSLTILPLFKGEQNSIIGRSHGATMFSLTFHDTTNEIVQQELIEKETSKFMQIINQILPKEIASQLLKDQKSISMTVEKVCVSFCDIVQFTPWCASQTAEGVVNTLNTMFTLFDDKCLRYRSVTKIKTIGDCYMSAAGIFDKGDSVSESSHQMLSFALDLVDSINEVNAKLGTKLRVRVGVAFGGPISAGLMGIRKPAFDVYGQVVNDAQAMESGGEPMKVHINKELYDIVNDAKNVIFNIREDGTVLCERKQKL